MMSDKIKLSQDFSMLLYYKCPLCSKPNHFIDSCSKVHFIPEKNFLISRLNYSKPNVRFEQILNRKLKKSNFRIYCSVIREKALDFQKNFEENSDNESGEFQSRTLENLEIDDRKVSYQAENDVSSQKDSPKSVSQGVVILLK